MNSHAARRRAARLLRGGWRWWLGELRALATPRLRRLLDRHLADARVEFDQRRGEMRLLRLSVAAPPALLATMAVDSPDAAFAALPCLLDRAHLRVRAIELLLAPDMLLRRAVSLPAAPPRLLRALLDHELERLFPLPASQLCFDARILLAGQRGGRMLVDLVTMEKPTAEALLHAAARAGFAVTRLAMRNEAGADDEIDLLDDPTLRPPTAPARHRRRAPAAGLALLLAVALLAAVTLRARRAAEEQAAALHAARVVLADHAALAARAHAAAAQAEFLPRQRRALTPAAIINEVARLLPDDSVLSDLTIDSDFSREGASVVITGNSRRATDLIGLLAASNLFANPRFAAAITGGSGPGAPEQRHFSIAFEAAPRPGAAP